MVSMRFIGLAFSRSCLTAQYNATATSGKTSPMRIAITYPITTGRSFRRGPWTALDLVAISVRRVEVLVPCMGIQGGSQEMDCQQCQPVERDRDTCGACVVQGVGDEPGREWQERHHEQHEQVDLQEDRI